MRILLIVKSMMMETLGPMYLSSVIKKNGHEAKIVDLSSAYDYAIKWEPEIIGYSILTGDREKFKNLNDRLKKVLKFKSVVGNCDPSFFPEGYDWADEICKGEGENWINDFLIKERGMVETANQMIDRSHINSIPWPDRTSFPNMKVRDFITSRGCPYKCSYCYNHRWAELFPDQKLRVRSVDDVVAEIKHVNPQYAYFQDSCFGVRMDWMREFAEKYEWEFEGIKYSVPYQCNFRPEMINPERGELLRKSGCVAVRMALESATNRLRSLIGRNTVTLRKVREAVDILKENRVQVMLQNILSLPGSTIEDDLFTLETNIKYKPDYAWASIYVPYPGTDLGDYCKKNGIYKGNYENITDCFFDQSILEFSEEYKEQSYCLQKIFALCVEVGVMPEISDLTIKNLPNFIHKAMRKVGDKRLYLGLL